MHWGGRCMRARSRGLGSIVLLSSCRGSKPDTAKTKTATEIRIANVAPFQDTINSPYAFYIRRITLFSQPSGGTGPSVSAYPNLRKVFFSPYCSPTSCKISAEPSETCKR